MRFRNSQKIQSIYFIHQSTLSQQAHHGQMTSKQRYINVYSVGTTLFRRRLTICAHWVTSCRRFSYIGLDEGRTPRKK